MRASGGAWLGGPRTSENVDELAGLTTSVSPDGESAIFAVELGSSQRVTVKIPFSQMGIVENVIRQASGHMQARLRQRPYLAHAKVLELVQGAERPDQFELFTDPITGDWCFLYGFRNAAPFALRVDPKTCLENMGTTMRMIRATMN